MLYTDNIGLKKPAYSEPADIADINENSDIIDREFGNRYLKSETYSVEQANNAIAQAIEALPNGLVYRGAVNYYKDLPTANNELGDTYSVKYQGETGTTADGNEYAWGEYDGTLQWIKLGVNAYTKDEIDEQRGAIESDILSAENDIAVNRTTLGTQCKNLLNHTAKTETVNGVQITVNSDNSITIVGKPTVSFYHQLYKNADWSNKTIKKGTYIVNGGSESLSLFVKYGTDINTDGGNNTQKGVKTEDVSITIKNETEFIGFFLSLVSGREYNVTIYPMLRPADITDNSYEPYKPTLQEQINALVAEIAELKTQITTE